MYWCAVDGWVGKPVHYTGRGGYAAGRDQALSGCACLSERAQLVGGGGGVYKGAQLLIRGHSMFGGDSVSVSAACGCVSVAAESQCTLCCVVSRSFIRRHISIS